VSEVTLGGYMALHERAAAFTGSDGQAYSVALWVEEEPDERGRYGGALLFVRWNPSGDTPAGHHETEYVVWGRTPGEAEQRLGALSLYDVKAMLDERIAAGRPEEF
jgi:hypothetical protein